MKIDAILMPMNGPASPLGGARAAPESGFAAILQQAAGEAARRPPGEQPAATGPAEATLDLALTDLEASLTALLGLDPDHSDNELASRLEATLRNLPPDALEALEALVTRLAGEDGTAADAMLSASTTDAAQPGDSRSTAMLQAMVAVLADDARPRDRAGAERTDPARSLAREPGLALTDFSPREPSQVRTETGGQTGTAFPGHLQVAEGERGKPAPAQQPGTTAALVDGLATGSQSTAQPGFGLQGASQTQPTPAGVPTTLPTPVQSPDFGRDFGQQLVRMAQQGPQQMTLQLHPQELGPLSVDLRISDQMAQLSLLSASPQVRSALEQALPMLRDALAEQGITLEDTHVGEQRRDGQQQQQAEGQAGFPAGRGQDGDQVIGADELALRAEAATRALEAGRINLYV